MRPLFSTRVLGAATAVLLAAGVAGLATVDPTGAAPRAQQVAVGGGDMNEPSSDGGQLTVDEATTTTTLTAPAAVTGSPTTTTTARRTASGSSASPTATTVPVSTAAAPRAGKYFYRVNTVAVFDGETERDEYLEELVVADAGAAGAEIRQRHTLVDDGLAVNVDEVAWRNDGRYLTKSTTPPDPEDPESQADECDWNSDLRTLAAPVVAGTAWSFSSSCGTMQLQGTGRIVGTDRTTVGGTSVDVVRVHVDVTGTDSGMSFTFTVDELFAPAYALTVEEVYHSAGQDEFDGEVFTYDDTETRRLQSIQPA